MNIKVYLSLASVSAIFLSSCSSTPEGREETLVATQKGVPGGVVVQTYQVTATVTAIDPDARKVTMVTPAGKKTVFKAGPEIVNFPQIRVGDQVKATLTEELVVYMEDQGVPTHNAAGAVVALAPVGAKPGAFVADVVQVKAVVTEIDHKRHKATLRFPDGSTRKVAVRKDVDLTKRSVGEEVVLRATESMAVVVEKP